MSTPTLTRTHIPKFIPRSDAPEGVAKMKPFVTACISCERTVYLTKTPLQTRAFLGLHSSNTDTFIPTTCYQCEQDSNLIYNRLTQSAATIKHDWPGFISANMVSSWWLYQACKERYGVQFDSQNGGSMVVVRIRDFWRKVLGGDATAELVEFKNAKVVGECNDWRCDGFFGQPSDI